MTQALQLLTVVAVAFGLACYGLIQGRKERNENKHPDPRQTSLAFADRPAQQEPDKQVLATR